MAAMDMNKLHNHLDSYIKILLGKYPNSEITNTYKNGMFKTKTKSVTSLTVVYCLLKILVPNKLGRVLWPLYDNKMEAEFRRIALELLADIFKVSSENLK
uniref:HAUS augmin-like complex subunit 6 N-terminal domain-containing protein n=1 Tax=Cacopsylla melanoneura TaxID=428564 RepID=A0A8D9B2L1_9HEMI